MTLSVFLSVTSFVALPFELCRARRMKNLRACSVSAAAYAWVFTTTFDPSLAGHTLHLRRKGLVSLVPRLSPSTRAIYVRINNTRVLLMRT